VNVEIDVPQEDEVNSKILSQISGWLAMALSIVFFFLTLWLIFSANWQHLSAVALVSCVLAAVLAFLERTHRRNLEKSRYIEESLRESEQQHRLVIAAMAEGVLLRNAEGRVLTCNPSAERLLGLPMSQLHGQAIVNPSWRTIHEDGSPFKEEEHPVVVALNTGEPCTNVVMGIQKTMGEVDWLLLNSQPIKRDGEETPSAVVVSFIEITDRKRTEVALRRQAQIIEQIHDSVVATNLDGYVTQWNKGAELIFGYTKQEAIGQHVADLYALEDREALYTPAYSAEEANGRLGTEVWARRKSGERCCIHLSLSLLKDDHGTPFGMIGYSTDITARKRAEEALRESEALLRLIIDNAMDAVVTMDAAGKITGWNPQAEAIFGWPASEAIGKNLADTIIPPEYRDAHRRALGNYLATGEATMLNRRVELMAMRRHGDTFPVELSVTPIMNPNGPVAFSAFIRDITKRRRAEEGLKQSEERYRTLVERMTDGLYRSTPDGKFIEVNPAMVKMLGYGSKKELMEIDIKAQLYFDPKEREELVDVLRQAGKDEIEVFRLRHQDGHEVWVEDHGRLVYNAEGKVLYHEGILRDITARRRAEESLKQSEERYRTLVERMTDGVYRSTPDGKFIEVNPAMMNMLGYGSKEELMGIDIKKQLYFDPKEREEMVDVLRQTGKDEIEVFRLRRQDGHEVWVEDHGRLVYNAEGKVLYHEGILRDITDRRRAEKELHLSEEKYRDLMENINDAIYAIDEHGVITYISPVIQMISGYSPAEVTGRNFTEFIHQEDLPRLTESMQETFAGRLEPLEYRIVTKSGDLRWVRSSSRPALQGNRVIGLRGRITDITARKQAEEALRASEQRYRLFVENVSDMISTHNRAGTYLYASPACRAMLGYAPEEIIGHEVIEFSHPDDLKLLRKAYKMVLGGAQVHTVGYRFRHHNGRYIRVETTFRSAKTSGFDEIIAVTRKDE
jgi:PAS domain S-box-containing protein